MASIDTDEFFILKTNQKDDGRGNLVSLVNKVFEKHPNAPAVNFRPILMDQCNNLVIFETRFIIASCKKLNMSKSKLSNNSSCFSLPRIGRWQHGRLGPRSDGKMIMRTDMVDNFFVHYVTQLSNSPETSANAHTETFYLRQNHAALLHFKDKKFSIFGQTIIPNDPRNSTTIEIEDNLTNCNVAKVVTLDFDNKHISDSLISNEQAINHGLTSDHIDLLVNNFEKRLKDLSNFS
jgi:hypothetical protein